MSVFIDAHMHYKSTVYAYWDMYYIQPEYRKKVYTPKLFNFVEAELKKRGADIMVSHTKVSHDHSLLFKRGKWQESEIIFTKWIGD